MNQRPGRADRARRTSSTPARRPPFVAQFIGRNAILDGHAWQARDGERRGVDTAARPHARTANGATVARASRAKIVDPGRGDRRIPGAAPASGAAGAATDCRGRLRALDVGRAASSIFRSTAGGQSITLEAHADKYPPACWPLAEIEPDLGAVPGRPSSRQLEPDAGPGSATDADQCRAHRGGNDDGKGNSAAASASTSMRSPAGSAPMAARIRPTTSRAACSPARSARRAC